MTTQQELNKTIQENNILLDLIDKKQSSITNAILWMILMIIIVFIWKTEWIMWNIWTFIVLFLTILSWIEIYNYSNYTTQIQKLKNKDL